MKISEKMKSARESSNLTRRQAAEMCNLKYKTLYNYESGASKPDIETIAVVCRVYNVSPDYFINVKTEEGTALMEGNDSNKLVPLYGNGTKDMPLYAQCNIKSHVPVEEVDDVDFALNVRGDSMINARIGHGDIVYIKKMPMVKNGDIAAVLIENQATLRRFYDYGNMVVLRSDNPKYHEMVFKGSDLKKITILGKVIYVKTKIY